jgi:hypothetical protein
MTSAPEPGTDRRGVPPLAVPRIDRSRRLLVAVLLLGGLAGARAAHATPSTEIWIPSVDVQPFLVPHLNFDTYVRLQTEPGGGRRAPIWLFGPTMGVLPWDKLQLEIGFDLVWQALNPQDRYPIYFHAKLGTPEDAMFKWSPAIVAGVYNLGIKPNVTNQNIGYAMVGRTIPKIGRLSLGYFYAHDTLFVDERGARSNHGFLAAWDRTMKEISPKLWLCVDYQGSMSWIGAVSFGLAWSFTDNISMIFGYDLYTNRKRTVDAAGQPTGALVAGRDTFTVQLDINLERLVKAKKAPEPSPEPPAVKLAPSPAPRPAASRPAATGP